MTRINCIPPEELHDPHLLAEYRELPRIFKLARPHDAAPSRYTLGKGHVIFFYDKLGYLFERQKRIYKEMKNRGFKPNFDPEQLIAFKEGREALWNPWQPDQQAIDLNRERIEERLSTMKRTRKSRKLSPNP